MHIYSFYSFRAAVTCISTSIFGEAMFASTIIYVKKLHPSWNENGRMNN